MSPQHVINGFIKDFVQDLHNGSAAIFAGAGMSKGSGYVDWPELLRDIANELGLDVAKEHDLISLAQFHVNNKRTADGLSKKILREFSEQAEPCRTGCLPRKILKLLQMQRYLKLTEIQR